MAINNPVKSKIESEPINCGKRSRSAARQNYDSQTNDRESRLKSATRIQEDRFERCGLKGSGHLWVLTQIDGESSNKYEITLYDNEESKASKQSGWKLNSWIHTIHMKSEYRDKYKFKVFADNQPTGNYIWEVRECK